VNYRESYGIFAVGGILFNHESERRGEEFVTRKIASAVARIHRGSREVLQLGRLDVHRDWGFAGDYTRAMHLMLCQQRPQDFVIATGEANSVADFARLAFSCLGLNWQDHVRHDPSLLRPAEIPLLRGDASRAREQLAWRPHLKFENLVERMVRSEVDRLSG